MTTKKKIGLALGGGAAKGLAHIGIIKALERAGIDIDFIAGTSMGALVGGYYAATKDTSLIENIALDIKKSNIFSWRDLIKRKDGALFKGESITERLKKELGDFKIENCQIPFTAITTNIRNGDEIQLSAGNLADAIRASIAIPLIFSPVEIDEKLLMDGGLANPVPADVVKEMGAEFAIAVDVSSRWLETPEEMTSVRDMYSAITQTLSVVEYQLAKNVLKQFADVVIKPPIFHYDWFAFEKAKEIIKIGEQEMELHLREIRQKTGYRALHQTIGEKFLDFILNKPH